MGKSSGQAGRFVEIARFVWKYRNTGIFAMGDSVSPVLRDAGVDADATEGRPEEFVADLQGMGPAFIKMGQSLSTRPDLVAPEYLEALRQLQDDCVTVDFETIREIVEQELGVRFSSAFETFDENPLASASIGQVHRATLRSGREVVVKVQRPGVRQQVELDMSTMAQIASTADEYSETGKHFGFGQWLAQFRRSLTRELDYQLEAENLENMAELLEKYPELVVPAPVWDFTSSRVLVMDYIAGVRVTDRSGMRQLEENAVRSGTALVRSYLDQLFIHGFVHVDPHPGNILITEDARLAVLDLGMITHISPRMRRRMLGLVMAVVEGRGDEAADRVISMGEKLADFDRAKVIRTVSQLVSEYSSRSEASEGMLLFQMTRMAADGGLRPPPEVILLGKTLFNLETLARELSPGADLRNVMQKHLVSIVQHRVVQAMKPFSVMTDLLEANDSMREFPRQLGQIVLTLAENRLRIEVDAIDENRFAANMQKIANRVTVG